MAREFTWSVTVLVTLLITAFCTIGCTEQRTGPHEVKCRNRLKQIGLALHVYHQQYGTFPPAVVRNADGQPMHSWRVLILPLMEETELYELYDFSQPWDSEHNRQLLRTIPDIYRCPQVSETGSTPFFAVVGDGMAWSETGAHTKTDFSDGLENTIMLIEIPGGAEPWTKPIDYHFSRDGSFGDSDKPSSEVVNVCLGDGSIYGISTRLPADRLKPLLTRNADDAIDKSILQETDAH